MISVEEHLKHFPKRSKVAFLFPGKEAESSEKWNNMIAQSVEVIHLIHPYATTFLEQGSAADVPLEQSQDDFVFLRDIEGQRDLPAGGEIRSRTKLEHEAPFAINESSNVMSDCRIDLIYNKHLKLSFLLIACTRRIVTARQSPLTVFVNADPSCERVPLDTQVFQHIAKFYNYKFDNSCRMGS